MQIGKPVDGRAVLAAWLQNDWNSAARQEIEFRLHVWNAGADLIERPRLDSLWDHWVRQKVLEGFREPVWERLPEDTRWVEALADPGEAGDWYVLPGDAAWDILSGGSGRIAQVAAGARAGELPRHVPVREAHRCQSCLDGVKRIARGIQRRPIRDPLLLLAPAEAGPYTVLDGHKRAAAAYWVAALEGRAADLDPLTAYVGISPQPTPFRRA